jgi:lipid II:glycine glycyltransferase (peptidoglycan interpeptide bridge formation enzyme)
MSGLVGTAMGDTGIYLLGATSDAGMKSKGSYLLQWQMMQQLKARGCRWYDLGGINPDRNPGVYHFKQGLGGQEVHQLNRVELEGSLLSGVCVGLADRARRTAQVLNARFFARKPVMAS